MNYAAVDRGGEYTKVEIPAEWKDITAKFVNPNAERLAPEFVKNIADIVNAQCGDTLPVPRYVSLPAFCSCTSFSGNFSGPTPSRPA